MTYAWTPATPTLPPPAPAPLARPTPRAQEANVCAQVRLQIDQEAVFTRKGVGTTLEIANQSDQPLTDVNVAIAIYDPQGELANDKFVILPPDLTGLTPATGGTNDTNQVFMVGADLWTLGPNTTGSARWVILPLDEAAPTAPVVYTVGGVFSYTSGGVTTANPLVPGPVTVYPNAKLEVKYFHQRDVISDDPFTPQIEPAEPFSLAVLVHNVGQGVARNFSITSAQPKIVENLKGLLIDFHILATEVAGQSLSPSLTVDFGDLDPGAIKIGRWLLEASLMGFFLDYSATFQHDDALGGRETSLIDNVEIHELIHLVAAPGVSTNGPEAFLVHDSTDPQHLPDTLYFSDDTTAPVTAVTTGTVDGPATADHLTVQLTASLPAGWSYLQVPDPADGQWQLTHVMRADGTELPVTTNAWITHYTFTQPGVRPTKENLLHLLDYNSSGSYDLVYAPFPPTNHVAPTSAVAALPPASTPQIPLRWTAQDPSGSGIASYDIFVSVNGGPYLPWLQQTTLSGALYSGQAGNRYAFYSVATDNLGDQEAPHPTPDAQTTVTLSNHPPLLAPITNQTVLEGATLRLTAQATDPDGAAETLTYSLDPGAPPGAAIAPTTGLLTWATGPGAGGTTNLLTVRVTDNGSPTMSATQTFAVVVQAVNHPPVLGPLANQLVHAGATLSLSLSATDPDAPPQQLAFRLAPGAPAGATLDPASGRFSWTPPLGLAGSGALITVIVTDDGTPPLSATNAFLITVTASNQPPVLAPIPNQVVSVGRWLTLTATATDADLPTEALQFSLDPGAPAGAAIDPATGAFRWRPGPAQAQGAYPITVRVTDNGQPPLSDAKTFTATVADYLEVDWGTAVTPAGASNSAPLLVSASDGLSVLRLALNLPLDRLTNVTFEPLTAAITNAQLQLAATGSVLTLAVAQTPALPVAQPVGLLSFTALANQTSALIRLRVWQIDATSGTHAYTNVIVHPGRLVLLGPQPVLDASLPDGGPAPLTLYGQTNTTYRLLQATALTHPILWLDGAEVALKTNTSALLPNIPLGQSNLFLRVVVGSP